ncbi:MAG: hypothetical protein ACLVHC_03860 [Eggerthella lenta]
MGRATHGEGRGGCGQPHARGVLLEVYGRPQAVQGKISDVLRETRGAFFGRVVLEGIGEDRGSRAFVDFRTRTSAARWTARSGTVPDLIYLVTPTRSPFPPTR